MTLYRITFDTGTIDIEAGEFTVTEGRLIILSAERPAQIIATFAPGGWRSIRDVEKFRMAVKAGAYENPRGREAARPLQAL